MIKEIECKFAVHDFSSVRKKLRAIGARLLWKGKEKNWFYSPARWGVKNRGHLLRIKSSDTCSLTLKANKRIVRDARVADEYEVVISDPAATAEILLRAGFFRSFAYSKRREHWKLGRAFIELDSLPDGRKFVEVESTHNGIRWLGKKLGLDFAKSTTDGYVKLLTSKRKVEKKRKPV